MVSGLGHRSRSQEWSRSIKGHLALALERLHSLTGNTSVELGSDGRRLEGELAPKVLL